MMVDELMEKLHLPIIIEIDEDGLYIVSCPLFKGCHSWGESIDDAMRNITEVIEMCLEETKIENLNTFVGFRELEVVADAKASCN
jgi:predicted RNase H-like HicB family nuclease